MAEPTVEHHLNVQLVTGDRDKLVRYRKRLNSCPPGEGTDAGLGLANFCDALIGEKEALIAALNEARRENAQMKEIDGLRSVASEKKRSAGAGSYRSKPSEAIEVSTFLSERGADEAMEVMNDPKYAWVDVGAEMVERRVSTLEQMEDSARQSYEAIRRRLEEANERLARLTNVEAILEENERLKVELALAGPPEAVQQLESMANKLGSAQGHIKALELQNSALKQALSNERIAHQTVTEAANRMLAAKVREELPGLQAPALTSEYDCVKCGGAISNIDIDEGWRTCQSCRKSS